MKLVSEKNVHFTPGSRPAERASARMILLAVVSFILGVAATAAWFHLSASRNAGNAGFAADDQSAVSQTAAPAAGSPPVRPGNANQPVVTPAAVEQVKQAIPNFASVSVDNGVNQLRTAALKAFAEAARETDAQVQAAQQQLAQAQTGQSAAEQQAAMKQLQQAQSAGTEKLQQIAAQLQAQIAALQQMKAGSAAK